MTTRSLCIYFLWLMTWVAVGCSSEVSNSDCPPEHVACSGTCVNIADDNNNCGSCGTRCDPSTRSCVRGRCQPLCPNGQSRCMGACIDIQNNQMHCGMCGRRCGPGTICTEGECVVTCAAGLTACEQSKGDAGAGVACVNTERDPANCGGCNNRCPTGTFCRDGVCRPECPVGQLVCGDRCIDPMTDNNNCGSCRAACAANFVCMGGRCRLGDCPAGASQCNGRCVDTMTDRLNCGGCSVACSMGQICSMGMCRVGCAASQTRCGEECHDTRTSNAHCGRCGNACATGLVCQGGECVQICQMGQMQCDGRCVFLSSDRQHCGGCGRACPGSQLCVGGACMAMCPTGRTLCGDTCIDLQTDPQHCGACGRACPAGQACVAATCRALSTADGGCAPPSLFCGTVCTNTRADNNHCGRCGMACSGDRVCVEGMCVTPCPAGSDRCGTACTDIQSDPMNCGACGTRCPTGMPFCQRGACTLAPPIRHVQAPVPPDVTYTNVCALPGATRVLTGTDDGAIPAALPFAFRYWATDMPMGSLINVCSNGWIGMTGAPDASLSGSVPSTTTPNGVIAAHWIDIVNRESQCIATVGAAPTRRWIVQWPNSRYFGSGIGNLDFEIVLHEGSNNIDVLYQNMMGANTAVAGIENQTGTAGVAGCPGGSAFSCAPPSGTRIRYVPSF